MRRCSSQSRSRIHEISTPRPHNLQDRGGGLHHRTYRNLDGSDAGRTVRHDREVSGAWRSPDGRQNPPVSSRNKILFPHRGLKGLLQDAWPSLVWGMQHTDVLVYGITGNYGPQSRESRVWRSWIAHSLIPADERSAKRKPLPIPERLPEFAAVRDRCCRMRAARSSDAGAVGVGDGSAPAASHRSPRRPVITRVPPTPSIRQ